jgi:hypothetical protein
LSTPIPRRNDPAATPENPPSKSKTENKQESVPEDLPSDEVAQEVETARLLVEGLLEHARAPYAGLEDITAQVHRLVRGLVEAGHWNDQIAERIFLQHKCDDILKVDLIEEILRGVRNVESPTTETL